MKQRKKKGTPNYCQISLTSGFGPRYYRATPRSAALAVVGVVSAQTKISSTVLAGSSVAAPTQTTWMI